MPVRALAGRQQVQDRAAGRALTVDGRALATSRRTSRPPGCGRMPSASATSVAVIVLPIHRGEDSRVVVRYGHVPKHQDPASRRRGGDDGRTGGRRPPVRPQDQRLSGAQSPATARHSTARSPRSPPRRPGSWRPSASRSRKGPIGGRRARRPRPAPRPTSTTTRTRDRPARWVRPGSTSTLTAGCGSSVVTPSRSPASTGRRSSSTTGPGSPRTPARLQAALARTGLPFRRPVRAQGQPAARDPGGPARPRRARQPGERRHRCLLAGRGRAGGRVRLAPRGDQLHRHQRLRARPRRAARRTAST